jgi:nucleoside phosphorylase
VLAALKQELAPLRGAIPARRGVRMELTGVGMEHAAASAERLCPGARLVLSTGCCGGLVAGAESGVLAIPGRVLDGGDGGAASEVPVPDPDRVALARGIAERLGLHCSTRPLITLARPLRSPRSKRSCHERTGAAFVDMETAAIARVAADLEIPYLSLRFVLDTVDESLPEAPMRDREGKLEPAGLLRALSRPRNLVSLAGLLLRMRTASGGLVRLVSALLGEELA